MSQNKEVRRSSNRTARDTVIKEKGKKINKEKQALLESLLRTRKANMKNIINKKVQKKIIAKTGGKVKS